MTSPPFRAEHVGSLLRPPALKAAHAAHRAGTLSAQGYAEVLEREVARAVGMQEEVGLRAVTDGEFRRSSWFGFFFEALEGFGLAPSLFRFRDETGHEHAWQTSYATGPIRRRRSICTEEYLCLRQHARGLPKVTMPSPSALHFFRGAQSADPAVYPDLERFWEDVLQVYEAEMAELVRLGCRYVQLDEVPLAMLCDDGIRAQVKAQGADPDALTRRYIDAANRVIAAKGADMTVGMHLCRGNFRSRWMASGGYAPVAERLFQELAVDAFFLEYDSARAGDFTPLAHMGRDKTVVLGLVSSKTPELEDADALKRRIDQASRFVPLQRLAISPQCGFASVAGGNLLSEDEQRRKLARVVEVASAIWS